MADAPRRGWTAKHDEHARAAGRASWVAWIQEVEKAKGYAICGRTNRNKAPCANRAGACSPSGKKTGHEGEGACGSHGGLSLAGPEHGEWIDGRSVRDPGATTRYRVTGRLGEAYLQLESEMRDAFDLTAEARMANARMLVLVEELQGDGGHVTGNQLAEVRDGILAASNQGDAKALMASFGALDRLVDRAKRADASWREWGRLADLKRRFAETHARQQAKEHGPVHWSDLLYVLEQFKQLAAEFIALPDIPRFRARVRRIFPASMMNLGAGSAEDSN